MAGIQAMRAWDGDFWARKLSMFFFLSFFFLLPILRLKDPLPLRSFVFVHNDRRIRVETLVGDSNTLIEELKDVEAEDKDAGAGGTNAGATGGGKGKGKRDNAKGKGRGGEALADGAAAEEPLVDGAEAEGEGDGAAGKSKKKKKKKRGGAGGVKGKGPGGEKVRVNQLNRHVFFFCPKKTFESILHQRGQLPRFCPQFTVER